MSWLVGNCFVEPFLLEVLRLNLGLWNNRDRKHSKFEIERSGFLRYDFDFSKSLKLTLL